MKESKETIVYSCGHCGKLFRNKSDADTCHADRTCDTCGKVIGKTDYYTKCSDCRAEIVRKKEQELYDKAVKMSYAEYEERFPSYPLFYGDDYYFYIEDLVDSLDEDSKKWAWGCKPIVHKLDAHDIIVNFSEQIDWDEYEMCKSELKEINEFCDKWNEKHSVTMYYNGDDIVVDLTELYEEGMRR